MAKDEIPKFIRDQLYARHHRLMEDDAGQAVFNVIDSGIDDDFSRHFLEERVRRHKIDQVFSGPFALPHLESGDFIQGFDLRGRAVVYPLQFHNAHCLTLAGSGSGKTTKTLFHAIQIAPRVRGIWLFDCRKAEFKKAAAALARRGVELIVLLARQMRFNPLQVPLRVEPRAWITRCSDMLSQVTNLPPRASKIFQITMHRLYEEMGVLDGKTLYPTLFDLRAEIYSQRDINAAARQALIDTLDLLLASLGPEVLAYRQGWPIHELARFAINFVLGGVPDIAQNLILNTLLLAEFTSRIARGVSNPAMDLWIAVDEGQRLLSRSTQSVNALADLWPLVRGTGIGLDLSVPTSHGLMPEALSFSASKCVGRTGSASDAELMGRAMGLNAEQLTWCFHHLRPGRMIAQVGEGEWRYPYVLDIPPLDLSVNEDTTTAEPRAFKTLPLIPAR